MSKQLMAFLCFLKSGMYGGLAMLILVQLKFGSDVITALTAETVLILTLIISVLEMLVNVADIPQKLK